MNLATRLADDFSATVRNRALDYYWQGRVSIQHGSDSAVMAHVQGADAHEVSLKWKDGILSVWCDCPYFVDSGDPCKHLWAAILAADAHRYLSAAISAKNLVLDCDGLDLDLAIDPGVEFDSEDEAMPRIPRRPTLQFQGLPAPKPPAWRKQVTEIATQRPLAATPVDAWQARREVLYVVDVPSSISAACLVFWLGSRDRKVDGSWTRPAALTLKRAQIAQLPLSQDREILSALAGGKENYGWARFDSYEPVPVSCQIPSSLAGIVLPLAVRTGRCYLRLEKESAELIPLAWDESGPFQFGLEMRRGDRGGWLVAGVFHRGEERMDLADPVLITEGGFLLTRDRVAPLTQDTRFEWIFYLRKAGCIKAPEQDQDELLAALLCSPSLPALQVPEDLRYEEVTLQPGPRLRILAADPALRGTGRLRSELSFDYEGRIVPALEKARGFYEAGRRRFLRRDSEAEKAAAELLSKLGLRMQGSTYVRPEPAWELARASCRASFERW